MAITDLDVGQVLDDVTADIKRYNVRLADPDDEYDYLNAMEGVVASIELLSYRIYEEAGGSIDTNALYNENGVHISEVLQNIMVAMEEGVNSRDLNDRPVQNAKDLAQSFSDVDEMEDRVVPGNFASDLGKFIYYFQKSYRNGDEANVRVTRCSEIEGDAGSTADSLMSSSPLVGEQVYVDENNEKACVLLKNIID